MPILPKEPDCYPDTLLDDELAEDDSWWLLYTKSRQEKKVARHLQKEKIPHYAPFIPQRYRSPNGRLRTSYVPLFLTYVFVRGGNEARHEAVCSGGVMKATPIVQTDQLITDLRQIRDLIAMEVPLTVASRIQPGQRVRVRNGAFAGYEGTVLRRENETLLQVCVRFMDQGVSVKLDDCQLEPI
ncbi:MAG: transcription termination/antitermination NusG family protein [Planctomycetota bacterium]